jgi:hypothetical protein
MLVRSALCLLALLVAPVVSAQTAGDAVVFDDELTLWAIPAPLPLGLTWRRPGPLVRRTVLNEALDLNRGIGHAGVTLSCAATAERPAAWWQGSVRSTGDDFRGMLLDDEAGMGILFATVPGRLEREDELQATLDLRARRGRLTWLRVGIASDTCHALLDYVAAAEAHEVNAQYGFVRPLYQEGAGCSAFSLAFLQLAGLVEPWMREEWVFDVAIPMELIGGELNPGNPVGLGRLMTISRGWARPDEPQLRLNGWDPTFMFDSIHARTLASDTWVEQRGRATGLVLDRRQQAPTSALLEGAYFAGPPALDSDARFLTAEE